MRRIRYLTLAVWLIGCISVFAQAGSGFDPSNPAEPNAPQIPSLMTVVAEPSGGGNPSPTGKYYAGATVNLRANPATGFRFVKWTNQDGEQLSDQPSFNITKKAEDEVITAHYVYEPTPPTEPNDPWLSLSLPLSVVAAEGGNVSGGGRYVPGTSVVVNASPVSNYVFERWTNQEGETVSELARFSYTVRHVRDTLTAHFRFLPPAPGEPDAPDATPKHHVFTVAGEGGTVSASQYIKEGQSVTLSATCNAGYVFQGWFKDGLLYNENPAFTFTMQTEDVIFEARFRFSPGAPAEPNIPGSAKKQVFYIENANGFQGETMNLSVFLSSLTDIGDLTFQLSFPARLVPSVETGITYSEGLEAYSTKTCVPLDATTLRFTFSGGTLRAGNGALVSFRIPVPADYSTGTKNPVRMAQISFVQTGVEGTTTANARNGHIGVYKHGDVNGDNDIDVVDIHAVMLYMAGLVEPSDGFVREAADCNGDGNVDEADLNRLRDVAKESVITAAPAPSANSLFIPSFRTAPAVTHRYMNGFSIHLNNEADVWGVQFDILLPEGMTIDAAMPGVEALEWNGTRVEVAEFTSMLTPLADGWTRVLLCPAAAERFITGFEGELLKVHYCTDSELPLGNAAIGLRNVVLALQRLAYERPACQDGTVEVVDFIRKPYDATLAIGDSHVATFVAPFDVQIPSAVKAYRVIGQEGTHLLTEKVNDIIPANTPVLVRADEAVEETFSGWLDAKEPVTAGILTGVFFETTAQESSFVLKEGVAGSPCFQRVGDTPTAIPPGRAYVVQLPDVSATQLSIRWDEIIDHVRSLPTDGTRPVFYDLQGRKAQTLRPGIYITAGRRKVLQR